MKFSGKVANESLNKLLNFGDDTITDPDKDMDPDPYRDTDETCLGRGMLCSSASLFMFSSFQLDFYYLYLFYHCLSLPSSMTSYTEYLTNTTFDNNLRYSVVLRVKLKCDKKALLAHILRQFVEKGYGIHFLAHPVYGAT